MRRKKSLQVADFMSDCERRVDARVLDDGAILPGRAYLIEPSQAQRMTRILRFTQVLSFKFSKK
jgi:hypothetical protein